MSDVTLVQYGLGNVEAFASAFRRMNVQVGFARTEREIREAKRLILPGVGSFDWAMKKLNSSGMRDSLDEAVIGRGVPVLGVCVGMQIMAKRSAEGLEAGLGWIEAEVCSLEELTGGTLPMPHMGWNDAWVAREHSIFSGLTDQRFYFLHSYCVVPSDPSIILATTEYGTEFVSAFQQGNVIGTQFHPEKSHHWGGAILKNFSEHSLC